MRSGALLLVAWAIGTILVICGYAYAYDGILNEIAFVGVMLLSIPSGGHPFILLAALWLIVPAWMLVGALRRALRRDLRPRWDWMVPALAGIVIAGYLTCGPLMVGDFIRFQIERTGYEAKIDDVRAGRLAVDDDMIAGTAMLAVFHWGGFLSKWEGVVYDEADYFPDPKDPAPAWAKSSLGEEILACPSSVRSMGGHFYVAHFTC
jgi:hypothetical protein